MSTAVTLRVAVRQLERWYVQHHRSLPWRKTHDPYRIWISEVMLQQTQVATVLPYYENFLKRWPTLDALAQAKEAEVLSAWSGLGYYSRARNLMRGAAFIRNEFAGQFPKNTQTLLKTPGIGPYTAGAILSIAYDLPTPLLDGNVQRVFARYTGEKREIENATVQKQFWELAKKWVDYADSPRHLNQGLMELGAIVCSKSNPKCAQCPIQKGCVAFRHSLQSELPKRKPRRKNVDLWWIALVFEHEGELLLSKSNKEQWWSDLWNFPYVPAKSEQSLPQKLGSLKKKHSEVNAWIPLAPQKHTVTHHRIHVRPYLATCNNAHTKIEGKWWKPAQLKKAPLSSLARKILSAYH